MGHKKLPIYHIVFDSQYLMASTFLRFQEYYESPKFRGKIFTLETYMDWYVKTNGNGEFTYFNDWGGFNIPSEALIPFYQGKFDPLSRKEKILLRMFKKVQGEFYIIGTGRGERDGYKEHELVHALLNTDKAYSAKVSDCLDEFNTYYLRKKLEKMKYRKELVYDEINAYAITNWTGALVGYKSRSLSVALKKVFSGHFGWGIDNKREFKKFLSQIHRWRFKAK